MRLENRIDEAILDAAGNGPSEVRGRSDQEFMKKNNITHESHEMRDMGLERGFDCWEAVTVWVPRN
jgi:hypothetical protein